MIKKIPDEDCGVNEEMFPCMGKCCHKKDASFMASYEKTCPYCDISTSLPYGTSLKTATIFECSRLGYGKRVTG
jgi:hypothetical protein